MIDNLIIKKATKSDIPEVAKLHIESWYNTYKGIISDDYLENMKNNLEKRISRMKDEFDLRNMIIALNGEEIVGFSEFVFSNKYSSDLDIDCELCGLYVKNDYLHMGIGGKLFDYVVNLFKEKNHLKMGLWCLKDNLNAVNFYTKKGGIIFNQKNIILAGKDYIEISFIYNL